MPVTAEPRGEVPRPLAAERSTLEWSPAEWSPAERSPAERSLQPPPAPHQPAPAPEVATAEAGTPAAQDDLAQAPAEPADEQAGRQGRKAARGKRSSVPSWDEIMFGSSRQRD